MMERYDEYKDSGIEWIGEIPAGWEVAPMKTIWSESKEIVDSGDPEQLLSVSEYYGVDYRKTRIGSDEILMRADSLKGYKACRSSDLVMNIMLAWKGAQGVSPYDGLVSPAYAVFTSIGNNYTPYAHYLYRTPLYCSAFKRNSTGIIDSRLRLYPDVFLRMPCIIPAFEEQKRIVEYLDAKTSQIDELIADQEKSIELLEEYRKAVISEAVTEGLDPNAPMKDSGIDWIGEIPKEWGQSKMKYLCRITSGSTPSKSVLSFWQGSIPWVSSKEVKQAEIWDTEHHITKEAIESCSTELYPEGTYVTVVRSGILKHTIPIARIMKPMAVNQDIKAMAFDDQSIADWVALFFTGLNDALLAALTNEGSTVDNLNTRAFENCPIIIPPKEIRESITLLLHMKMNKIDALIADKRQLIDKLKEYRKSLIFEAVTGKFKVPGVA